LFTVFALDWFADVIIGIPWLRSHGLAFVYEDSQVCFCAETGCISDRRVRIDLRGLPQASATPAGPSLVLLGSFLLQMICEEGFENPMLASTIDVDASLAPAGLPGAFATLARCRSGGGGLGFRCPGLACTVLASKHGAVLLLSWSAARSRVGVSYEWAVEFELRIDVGDRPMPRSELYRHMPLTLHLSSSHESRTGLGVIARFFAGSTQSRSRSAEPLQQANQPDDETRGLRFFSKLEWTCTYHRPPDSSGGPSQYFFQGPWRLI
jgi:hypothetical protein